MDAKEWEARENAVAEREGVSPQLFALMKACGWAPGDYMNRCVNCGKENWNVDKRATCCKPCALRKVRLAGAEATIVDGV